MIFKEELDERIKDESDIQTRLRYDDELVGEMGYFSCGYADLRDLSNCHYDKLAEIDTRRGDNIFAPVNEDFIYSVFIPEKFLKPSKNKYRPFSLEEFVQKYPVGKALKFRRNQEEDSEEVAQFWGYKTFTQEIFLGNRMIFLPELFEKFEVFDFFSETWVPFGVECKE